MIQGIVLHATTPQKKEGLFKKNWKAAKNLCPDVEMRVDSGIREKI